MKTLLQLRALISVFAMCHSAHLVADPVPETSPLAAPLFEKRLDWAPTVAAQVGNRYGEVLAMDAAGEVIAVGAPGDSQLSPNAGAVYILNSKGETTARLVPEGTEGAVAVSRNGNWVAVSATQRDRGRVFLFERVTTPGITNLIFDARMAPISVVNWVQRTVLEHSDPSFGASLAFKDSSALAIGAPFHGGGRVFVYALEQGSWILQGSTGASDQQPYDAFGASLSFYGDRLAVGAPNANGGRGAAYVIQLETSPWQAIETDILVRDDSTAYDHFGASVAFVSSGDLLVGVPFASVAGAVNAGQVDLFQLDGRFRFRGRLQEPNPEPNAHFGAGLGGSGGFVVGAPGANNGAGRVHYGGWPDGSPQLLAQITNPHPAGAGFGAAVVSSEGNNPLIAVGAPGAGSGTGSVLLARLGHSFDGMPQFTREDGDRANPAVSEVGKRFGMAMALEGDTAVIGMPYDRNAGRWRGSAYVFVRRNGEWQFEQRLIGDDAVAHSEFGAAVTIQGGRIAVGAPSSAKKAEGRGAVFIYERGPAGWQRLGSALLEPKPWVPESTWWGAAVGLSGTRLAVGAPGDSERAGAVTVFELDDWFGGEWWFPREWTLTSPNSGQTNAFGGALVFHGETLIVGEPGGIGSVHIYQREGGGSWNLAKTLEAQPQFPGEMQDGGAFGAALSFDGHHLAVGQPEMSGRGRVHLFREDWAWDAMLVNNDLGGRFGYALALQGPNLLVGAPGVNRTFLFQRSEKKGWMLESPFAGGSGSEFGAALAFGEDHFLVTSPIGGIAGEGGGLLTAYDLAYDQADKVAEYVTDLLYPRRGLEGMRHRDNAAFLYRADLYGYDATDETRRVRIRPETIETLYGEEQRTRIRLAEAELLAALRTAYEAGSDPGSHEILENLLLDLYYDWTVAESLLARKWLGEMERQRIEGHPNATGWVIDLEIDGYDRIAKQDLRALSTYFALFHPDRLAGYPTLGKTLFTRWVAERNLRSPTYTDGNEEKPVAESEYVYEGYKDLVLLYTLLRDHAEHVRTLAELLFARGDLDKMSAQLAEARQILFLQSSFLENLVPNAPTDFGLPRGLAEIMAGVASEMNQIEGLQSRVDLGLNPLGYDPQMLLLVQKFDRLGDEFNSFDSFLTWLQQSNSVLRKATHSLAEAQQDYEKYRDRQDQFKEHLRLYQTAYDDRLFDIWGKHLKDIDIEPTNDPTTNYGGGIWQASQGVEEARNRLRRNLLEIENLRERIEVEVERRGKEKGINNAIAQVRIEYANQQADLTETIGHITAAQSGFNSIMDSLSPEKITKGGIAAGLISGAGNVAAEEFKARYQAQKERLAGLEQAKVIALEDKLLDANSAAIIKNLLLDIQAALVDSEQASILLEQSLGQYQALVDEAYDIFNRISQNNAELDARYFADPIHALRAQRGFIRANLSFGRAQHWVFYLARALEYKWNEPFRTGDYLGRGNLSVSTVFQTRNAKELNDLVDAMVHYDGEQTVTRLQNDLFDYFSVREDFFGYKRAPGDAKTYTDPRTGLATDALGAFRSRLHQSIKEQQIAIRFNTVRSKDSFFLGPKFCESGLPKPGFRGTYLDKIIWVAVRLRVSQLSPDSPLPLVTGRLFYGGSSYIRNHRVGSLSPETPDLLKNEMSSYPVRRWYSESDGKGGLRWLAEDGLWVEPISILKYTPGNPGNFGGIENPDVLQAAERNDVLKERPVAASDWRLLIPADKVNIDDIEDIEIYFYHWAAMRVIVGSTCE